MSDKNASIRQSSTIGCFLLLIVTAAIFIVWISWRILHAPVPPKPVNDSIHKADSMLKLDSIHAADSLRDVDSLIAQNRRSFFYSSRTDFQDSLFRFHVTYDSMKTQNDIWEHSIRKIEIYKLNANTPFQTILTHSDEYVDYLGWCPMLKEDMNFDGYTDIGYITGSFVNGCSTYGMWLYDPVKKKFMENEELEHTFDPVFDPKEKLVYSVLNETNSPVDETRECFSWKNGKLQLEHREECLSGPDGYTQSILTMTRRINDKLQKRSKDYDTVPTDSIGSVIYNWNEMK